MAIPASAVLHIADPADYKVHLASWNQIDQPLEVFVRDRDGWDEWNRWRAHRDDFNRKYVLALIDFYHEQDTWLFGGIYKVTGRDNKPRASSYRVEPVPDNAELIGRLKIAFRRPGRGRVIRLESYFDQMTVSELLRRPYSGERFPGVDRVCIGFQELQGIYASQRSDWRAALENVKGVYLIANTKTGQKYVGSAYGDAGIWARWGAYVLTGHGWTDELTRVIRRKGIAYAQAHFQVSLLEVYPPRTEDHVVMAREAFWKRALLTREPFGYNRN